MFASQSLETRHSRPPPATETDANESQAANPVWHQLAQNVDAKAPGSDAGVTDAANDAGVTDAGVPVSAGVPEPPKAEAAAPTGPNACATAAEEKRKKAFRFKLFSRPNFRPSNTLGMFDAGYSPLLSLMTVISKLKLKFLPADNAPDMITRWMMKKLGMDTSVFFWTKPQQENYKKDFMQRIISAWTAKYKFISKKPCWPFTAIPIVMPRYVKNDNDAHFILKIHKSSDAAANSSAPTATSILRPQNKAGKWQGSGDLWESDSRTDPDFSSKSVAKSERERLQSAITTSAASPVLFDQNQHKLKPVAVSSLRILAAAMKKKNPSDPAIPLKLEGFASMEGDSKHNKKLSRKRVLAVKSLLAAEGVPQPLKEDAKGPVGTANDSTNRKVDISADSSFENSYSANKFSAAEHEYGHILGMPDEYLNKPTGPKQRDYMKLVQQAGVDGPAKWGNRTSSIMSTGVDVLPRHYVTMWEALGTMTDPDIPKSDWKIS